MYLVGFILLLALLIPIMGIVIDSPIGRAIAHRLEGANTAPPGVAELALKLELLEDEVEELHRAVQALQEENGFLQRLLQEPHSRPTLPPTPKS